MNKPIRTIAVFCLLLFVLLLANSTYLQYYQASALDDDQRNRRVINADYSRERGQILVDGEPVAESVPSDDEFKFQRTYPQPLRYAPVTGFFSFNQRTGIEDTQNDVLSGDDSRLFVTKLVDLLSNDATKGGNVELTLDADAQAAAYDGLNGLPGKAVGSVVAIEPRTGRILAMASVPTYDPNPLSSHDIVASDAAYDALEPRDPLSPLLNRATQVVLPPGSTFKVVTAAAAIESGVYSKDDMVPGGPTYQLPLTSGPSGLIDNESRDCGTDRITFEQAMANSCNTSFAAIAGQVGAEQMAETAEGFGFNEVYLDDLRPQAKSIYPDSPNAAQLGQTGIGQFDVRATSLQMAMVVAGVANRGVVMRPYLVDQVTSPELDVLDKTEPEELSRAISADTADQLTDLLVYTVDSGTAKPGAIDGIDVAGKTGTAQSGVADVPPYAWYVSFAPADDPQVAVAVQIQQAGINRDEIAGGVYGGPIAKAVMEAIIK